MPRTTTTTTVGRACLAAAALLGHPGRPPAAAQPPAQVKPPDKEAVARKLAELADADRRELRADPWDVCEKLTQLPGDDGFALLRDHWPKLDRVETRQQFIKHWYYTTPYPLHPRNHPRLLDVLDLGMRDRSPAVQNWALNYLKDVAFRDFAEDFPAYETWYKDNRQKPVARLLAETVGRFAAESADLRGEAALKKAGALTEHWGVFRDVPEARRAAADSGLLKTLERWVAAGDAKLAAEAVKAIGQLKPGEAYLRRVVLPLLADDKPAKLRAAAAEALTDKANGWAVDALIGALKSSLNEDKQGFHTLTWPLAEALAEADDPRAVPAMIAVIDADNTYDTVYGVGHFGLGKLTGVRYQESHNGAWWRQWWAKNKGRYPEAVRNQDIPKLVRVVRPDPAPADADAEAEADDAGSPAEDLRAGGDANKRYFLIGKRADAKPPAAGYALLIVLPGGDGGADFHPFVRRMHANALNSRWLIAQPVAPKWDDKQFDRVVWPTEKDKYPGAKFSTEQFVDAVLADVKTRAPVDPKRVVLLGWSSGGPACYAAAARKDSPAAGAFVAMSVFRPEMIPAAEAVKGKAFYLLQSPDDKVTAVRFAEAAEKSLRAAGARVRLDRYAGGHGWRGDVWGLIRGGLVWLEKPEEKKP